MRELQSPQEINYDEAQVAAAKQLWRKFRGGNLLESLINRLAENDDPGAVSSIIRRWTEENSRSVTPTGQEEPPTIEVPPEWVDKYIRR